MYHMYNEDQNTDISSFQTILTSKSFIEISMSSAVNYKLLINTDYFVKIQSSVMVIRVSSLGKALLIFENVNGLPFYEYFIKNQYQ